MLSSAQIGLRTYWRSLVVFSTPILLIPLPVVLDYTEPSKCAYVLLLMVVYWMLEVLPLAVTALIPVALLPMFGVMSTGDVAINYMKSTGMLFFGCLTIALSIENCNLHKRVGFNVIRMVGISQRRLLLGFMIPTAFLSMWLANTSVAALMMPIVEAILDVFDSQDAHLGQAEDRESRKRRAMFSMSVAYAANIGGTGTLIGTVPNSILIENLSDFPGQPLSFGTWVLFATPLVIVNVAGTWLWLMIYYLGIRNKKDDKDDQVHESVKQLIEQKCKDLGPVTYQEKSVSALFFTLVSLWFFRSPGFIPGWGDLLEDAFGVPISDATPALMICMALFVLPAKPNFFRLFSKRARKMGTNFTVSPPLLAWKYVEKNLAWGVIFLLGGSLAIADASEKSCLSAWIGSQFYALDDLPPWVASLVFSIFTVILTQMLTNTACATLLLPVFRQYAIENGINPIYLMLPPTLLCSCVFMFPVSTVPNTIAFQTARMTVWDMVKVGTVTTLFCIITTIIACNTYGYIMFDLGQFPDWAENGSNLNATELCSF